VVLETRIEPNVTILGDIDRLRQILWNLLTNAVKFTPAGGRIELAVFAEGNQACIVVRDTGIGVHPDALPHIFKRFWQADSAGKRGQGGLGLGLALSRYLAELHGGTIQAKSAGEGQGAEFRVILPLRIAEVARTG
jgi:two-component system, chemotaxis family, CheB/CheR fusion protein